MKICPVCKAAVDDAAEYCDNCGNDEFYDQPQQFEQYDYNDQYQQNGYAQPQYPQNDYNQYQPQYPQQNDYNQYQQQYPQQNDYNQYQQQYPQQNDYNQYQQQHQYPQQNDYNQYQQQPQYPQQNDYNRYQQQPQQPQYPQQNDYNQYQQQPQYEQPPVEQQPVYEEQQPVEQQQPVEEVAEPVAAPKEISAEETETQQESEHPEEPAEPEKPKENPYEVSKNFVFEKKEKPENAEPETKEMPKNVKGFIEMFMNTKDHTYEFDKDDIAKNQKNALVACFGVTFWLPFISKDYSRYARFYGNQGLLTLITMIPSIIFYSLITGVVICNACTASVYNNGAEAFRYLTFGGWIAAIIFFAICFAIPIFIIYCSVTSIKQGKAKDIPFIGKLRLIS